MDSIELDLVSYYKAIEGDFDKDFNLQEGRWYINFDKKHSFIINSDFDGVDEEKGKIIVRPIEQQNLIINKFSDKDKQFLYRTKISKDNEGGENVELNLDDRIVTFIIDQSGSMTWNDNKGIRHEIVIKMINDINIKYPGEVKYNIIEYGGKNVKILFYGIIEDDRVDIENIESLNSMLFGDEEIGFAGVRVVRKIRSFPANPLDGEIIAEGFMTRFLDINLVEHEEYFYSIFTFNKDYIFSQGKKISVVPREPNIPRGITLTAKNVFIGMGVIRDENTIGIWHFDEGKENILYDFSDSKTDLIFSEDPLWYSKENVAAGESGVRFDGISVLPYAANSDNLEILSNGKITMMAWIFPYDLSKSRVIISRDNGQYINYAFGVTENGGLIVFIGEEWAETIKNILVLNKWQHVAVTIDLDINEVKFYVDGIFIADTATDSSLSSNVSTLDFGLISGLSMRFCIGHTTLKHTVVSPLTTFDPFFGRMTEISVHNTIRDNSYINDQIISNETGLNYDNGDRLICIKYAIPEDYNFVGGNVKIIRKEFEFPTWHGDIDSSILELKESILPGFFYVTDADDFVLGETYYYRIFSQNSLGNYNYNSDSEVIDILIPKMSSIDFQRLNDLEFPFYAPMNFIAQEGNKKTNLTWQNVSDNKVARIKIYHSYSDYPVVSSDGNCSDTLVFNGNLNDVYFVHRNIENDKISFYTIFYTDKYGRPTQTSDGVHVGNISVSPNESADETAIPLLDVSNIYYDIIDRNSIVIFWDHPIKFKNNLNGYLDQNVYLFAVIVDEFGRLFSNNSFLSFDISSIITKKEEANDVFKRENIPTDLSNEDFYNFVITKNDEGIIQGILTMISNNAFLRLVDKAEFTVRIKSIIPNIDNTDNFFEYFSDPIHITLENPWKIELINRDNKLIKERCYYIKVDEEGRELSKIFSDIIIKPDRLVSTIKEFNGIYVGSSNPFVARAILTYKGESISSFSTIDVAIWDAENELCMDAQNFDFEYKGEKIRKSEEVIPPFETTVVQYKFIDELDSRGNIVGKKRISFVDIPIFSPVSPQAIRIFVQGGFKGFSSIQDIYVVFQTILNIDITANAPVGNGVDIVEQFANSFLIDPDHPDDKSKTTLVPNGTIVEWKILKREKAIDRPFYSIDFDVNLQIADNGIYSLIRNGSARNVFFGPANDVAIPFEQYEINATIIYNGENRTARQFIEISGEDVEKPFFLKSRFLMEFALSSNGNGGSAKQNNIWADGIDYLRLDISRDPNSSVTRFSDCFRKCANIFQEELIELNSGQLIKLKSNYSDLQFLWGDIIEFLDPYTGRWELQFNGELGIDYFTSNREATISLEDESIIDTTHVFVRINTIIPPRSKIETTLEDELREGYLNPCECLVIKDRFTVDEDIVINGSTVVFIEDNSFTISGGGDEKGGVPPTVIAPYEPLWIGIVSQKVNGEDFGKFGFIEINKISIIDITVEVMFSGNSIPEGTPIFVVIGNNDGLSKLISENNTVFVYRDEESGKSLADIRILPIEIPKETFTENVKIISKYDELNQIEREQFVFITVTVLSEEDDEDNDDPFDQIDEPESDSVFSGSLERYNTLTNMWSTIVDMNEPRGNIVLEFYKESLYAIGGINKNVISGTNEQYNLFDEKWLKVKNMPTARFGSMSVIINGIIYVIGGITKDFQTQKNVVSRKIEAYNIENDDWLILEDMPIIWDGFKERSYGVCFGCAKHINVDGEDRIYIISGGNEINNDEIIISLNDRVLYYNVNSDSWFFSDVFLGFDLDLYQRFAFNYFLDNNNIIVLGGFVQNDDGIYKLVQDSFSYDVISQKLSLYDNKFSIFPVLKGFSASVTDNFDPSFIISHYFLGGTNDISDNLKLVEKITVGQCPFEYNTVANMLKAKTGVGAVVGTIDDREFIDPSEENPSGVYRYLNIPHIFVAGGYTSGREEGFLKIDLQFHL